MTILAVYYTLADIVLLLQCFWYKGFTLRDDFKKPGDDSDSDSDSESTTASEQSPLLSDRHQAGSNTLHINGNGNGTGSRPRISDIDRRHSSHSQSSFRERYLSIDGTHLSPVTPLHDDPSQAHQHTSAPASTQAPQSTLQTVIFNLSTIVLVCAAGVFGWYLSARNAPPPPSHPHKPPHDSGSTLQFSYWGQIFGYICAILYLGSRIPQLLLNYRRKSTEGISMLFFLFACLGNLTYVLSILVYKPKCRHRVCEDGEAAGIYWRYIAVNASWLLGSFGTLLLDAGVFVQYFLYRKEEDEESDEEE